ncbi:hypothetical protein N9383_03855 [Granulosicoccus sp.]|nr:hypothetical protein [Granulosicoccus sp.]
MNASRVSTRIIVLGLLLLLALTPASVFAHEMWVLNADQVTQWDAKPLPRTYTSFTLATVATVTLATIFNAGLILLHRNGGNELFPVFRSRMRSMRPYTSVVLRICLSWVLLSSAMALEPRYGNAVWSHPTLLAPDILISDLPSAWHWLRWLEISIGVALIAGVYVRAAAAACLILVCIAVYLTGMAAVSYAPVYAGVALYLLIAGGGSKYLPLPVPRGVKRLNQWLSRSESISRAQFLMRIFAGANFLYLAVYFKLLQPNLMLAIIEIHSLPIMGLRPDVFVVIIAAVEVSIGLLVIFGVLLRFLSVVMIGAFIFFAICLSDAETLTSHMLYYGVAISFLFNGNGQWSRRQARDIPANILVTGNSIAAVAAVQHLEKILPDASNVNVTLLSKRSDIQFNSMLPEVVSGAVQPNTLINSLTKLFARTRLILGEIKSIDNVKKTVSYASPGGSLSTVGFDQLIVADDQKVNHDCESQTDREGINYLGSVVEALDLKQNLLRHFLGRRFNDDNSQRPVNIAIFGGGERGSALAMEIFGLADSLKLERCIPWGVQSKIFLLESNDDRQSMSDTILHLRARHFVKRNIKVIDAAQVATLCSDSVRLQNGKAIRMDVVVNLSTVDVLPHFDKLDELLDPIRTARLTFAELDCVWLASYDEVLKRNPQRRISRQLEQSRTAAFNAWMTSQGMEARPLKRVNKAIYECYMGRHSIATWHGIALPGAVGWLLNRLRCISTLPGLERKLRVVIDWALDFVFSNDTSGFLEHDYELNTRRNLHLVPPVERDRDMHTQNLPDEMVNERRDGTSG